MSRRTISIALSVLIYLTFLTPAFADEISISLSGNGSASTSDATVTVTSITNVEQTNTAEVINNIEIAANTGDNLSSNNSGDVAISTGDIESSTLLQNSLDQNISRDPESTNTQVGVSLSDNGTGSTNTVTVNLDNDFSLDQENDTTLENNTLQSYNTGGNEASGNSGSVTITTGDIKAKVEILNCLNQNLFGIFGGVPECPKPEGGPPGEKPPGGGDESQVSPPVTQVLSQAGPSANGPSAPGPSAGEVLGAAILPITGSSLNIWTALLGSLIFMVLGYLLIMKSYTMELALVRKYRGRYYIRDPGKKR